ncbi:hypothetical protein [Actinacidiphila sp. bgisy145]|uniref:hypothetical protein n=1 Tax=Actinacidiphila sp. bgisy145 TaxID=3413792 RepID=UPI003EBDC2A8
MPLSRMVLSSGRSIDLTELRMSSTYAGVLEGYPSKLFNDRTVRRLRRRAEAAFPSAPVHLLPPTRSYPDGPAGPFGPVEVLPSVTCIGVFDSTVVSPALDPVLHRSTLTVAWFQPTPSPEHADPALHTLPWDTLAGDYAL